MFGPYEIVAPLGRGGMGEVHRARDTVRGRTVALKRLHQALAADDAFRERFRRESRLAARLSSPHVIPVHDWGEIDGRLYIDMRLAEGADLAALLRTTGPLPPARAVDLLRQIAAALDSAHAAGLVHRDVKPSNVLVTDERGHDFAYLVDFGIVRALDDGGGTSLTGTGAAIGTLAYMAPELFVEGRATERSDVYALTCVLHEMLTGQQPFPVHSGPALMHHHLSVPPPRPSEQVPGLPRGLDDVVARGMDKEPTGRYPTPGDLAEAAGGALDAGPAATPERDRSTWVGPAPSTPPDGASRSPGDPRSTAVPPPWTPTPPPVPPPEGGGGAGRRGRRLVPVLAAGLAVVIAAVVTLVVVTRSDGDGTSDIGGGSAGTASAPAQPRDAVLPAGDGQGRCAPGTALAYAGTVAGQNASLGLGILNGAQLAVDQHNAANPNCQVDLVRADTGGTQDTALGPVTSVINNTAVLGMVGLPFSGESRTVGPALEAAGLVHITPSATSPSLSLNGWTTFFRGLGNDAAQGAPVARYVQQGLNARSACVIKDDSEYGISLAASVNQVLGPQVAACQADVRTNQTEFSAVVGQVRQANPQAIVYAGYYQEAAPLVRQLRAAGVQATVVAPDGVKDQQYPVTAGSAAEGTLISCPCVPSEGFTDFTDAFRRAVGTAPPTYAAEAYDVTTILLRGIDRGASDRSALLRFVRGYDGIGLTKRFRWGSTGELTETPIWLYRVRNSQIVPDQQIA